VFPPAGWVRIGDEVLGYTSTKDTVLLMPKAMKPATAEEEAATGPGLLRGRFGTRPDSHDMDAPVFLFPARFPDRYLERAVHPDTSSILFAREIPGALYKRISFDDYVPAFTRVHVFVRFDGTPDWDSDRIYDVSSDRVKGGDRDDFERSPKRYLFEIKKPHGENRLMVQADRIEVRIQFEYTRGAFDDTATPPPDSFKRSPWLQALRIEYAAPTCVHYSEGR
jgi:hypothetical protein